MSTSVPVWKPLPSMILRTTKVAFRLDLESKLDFPDFTSRVWLVCLVVDLGYYPVTRPLRRRLANYQGFHAGHKYIRKNVEGRKI